MHASHCLHLAAALVLSVWGMSQAEVSPAHAQRRDDRLYDASMDMDQLQRYMDKRAVDITENALRALGDNATLRRNQPELRRQFRAMIGLDPLSGRTPLNVRVTGTVDRPDFTIEKIVFESMPGFYMTGNLYKPKSGSGPFPTVLYVCGHHWAPEGVKTFYQVHGKLMARNGYVVLIIDPIQLSEVYGLHHGTASFNLWHWIAMGYTPSGVEVWNAMRAIDYLMSRPDVDDERIGITGMSGGGHVSWFTGAADDRIHVVIPANGTGTARLHVQDHVVNFHCDCAFFLNLYRYDWTTLAALIAPRPLRLHNATHDRIYPPAGYKKVLADAQNIYAGFGMPDRVSETEISATHQDTSAFRQSALRWFDQWFKITRTPRMEEDFPVEKPETLSVLNGYVPPNNRNAVIEHTFAPRARLEPFTERSAWERHRDHTLAQLRTRVFRRLPVKAIPETERIAGESDTRSDTYGPRWLLNRDLTVQVEPDMRVSARLYTPGDQSRKYPSLLYIASSGETIYDILQFARAKYGPDDLTILALFPRGTGPQPWPGEQMNYIRRAATFLLGTTLHTMQLADVLAGVDVLAMLPTFNTASCTVFGKNEAGILGLYAAVLDPRLTQPGKSRWKHGGNA